MASRIINSPGVQISETDQTQIQSNTFGTTVFVMGFANKGPTDEVLSFSTLSEFEAVYGTPTTAPERYFYYSVKPLFGTGATILTNRLPYGSDAGDGFGSQFSAIVYPVVAVSGNPTNFTLQTDISGTGGLLSTLDSAHVDAYVLGKPQHFTLTETQYLSCMTNGIVWSNTTTTSGSVDAINSINDFGKAGLIIFNKAQTTVNDRYEGYYIGLVDNSNNNPATQFNGIVTASTVNTASQSVGSIDTLTPIPNSRLSFALSGTTASNGTLSQAIEKAATYDISTNAYNDFVTLGVFKLRQSIYNPSTITLDFVLEESFVSSLDFYRQRTPTTGGPVLPAFLATDVANGSRNVTVMVNDNVSNRTSSTWLNAQGIPKKSVRMLSRELQTLVTDMSLFTQLSASIGINHGAYAAAATAFSSAYADDLVALGAYVDPTPTTKNIGSIPAKIDRTLQLIDNEELFDIDVTIEAGLGTIYTTLCASGTSYYDDTAPINAGLAAGLAALQTTLNYNPPADSTQDLRGNYNTIFSRFATFASDRMDHIFLADPIRHILVQGPNTKTLSDKTKSCSQHVFSPLRHQFELANTSYAAAYANWARVNDAFTQTNVWVPFSGYVAADYVKSDRDFAYWSAPAGFTRGLVGNVYDVAITPNQKQRDDLYKFNLNPIASFVKEGIVIYGQKTLSRIPSAFDRVNVRRLFIILEKRTKNVAKFYVFEPNTLYTRTRVSDDLTPIFEAAKSTTVNQGIYDYIIVCSDKNNTGDIIDANELVIDIYIKAVRTGEFILVNFYATRTSTNFQEILR